jgi:HEAT repeat protein
VLSLCASIEPSVRRAAYCAAAALPGSRSEVALLRGLADKVPALQVAALDLLVRHGGERITATLRALLASNDSLRYHVIRALGRLRAADAVSAMVALFPLAARHEQVEIVAALSQIGTPPAKAFLIDCLRHPQDEIRRAGAQGVALQA